MQAMKFGLVVSLASVPIVYSSPVEKVVSLLDDLKTRVENDAAVEQQVYDKFACWCESTTGWKAAAIHFAMAQIRSQGQQILSLKGQTATLTSEVEELGAKIKENEEAQEKATNIRTKENTAFMAEALETKQALAALQKAVKTLVSATNPVAKESLLQASTSANAVKLAIEALPIKVTLKHDQASLLSEFAVGGYAPQSATVQGMLADMYTTFTADLEDATKDEAMANRDFEDFIFTKQTELKEMMATKAKKEGDKAEAEGLLADTTQEYDDTEAQKEADITFFDETKEICTKKAKEWTNRKEMREEELKGIKEGIKILSSDEAREIFAKAIKPGKETGSSNKDSGVDIESFLQVESMDSTNLPQRAFAVLKAAASKSHSIRLAQLSVSVRLAKSGHFDSVIKAINEIMLVLKDEESSDIAKRDECKDKFNEIKGTVADISWKVDVNDANIDKLEKQIEKRTDEKTQTIASIEDIANQIKGMEDQRNTQHEDFKTAKADDVAAVKLLKAARDAISDYYKKNQIEMGPIQGGKNDFIQKPEFAISEDQAPDADFTGSGSRKTESKGVIGLMTMLMEDLNDEIKAGLDAEEEAQLDFEKMLKAAKNLKKELISKKISLEEIIAKRGEQKTSEGEEKQSNQEDQQAELEYKKEIKPDCDWILGAFEDRALKRSSEMDGLVQAKSLLAGAKPSAALLEKPFDDAAFSKIRFLGVK